MKKKFILWTLRLGAAAIFLQTLYFKFSAAPESVYIFSALGMEPYGRIGSGAVELLASILLLIPRTTLAGAFIGAGTMAGAIAVHLLFLGIEVKNDGGTLFILAIIAFLCCSALIYDQRNKISGLLHLKA